MNPILIKSLDRKNLGDKNKKDDHFGNSLNSGYLGTKILQPSVSKINLRKHGSPSYLDRKLQDTQRNSKLSKRSSQPSRVLSIKPLGKNSLLTPQNRTNSVIYSNQNSGRVTPINLSSSSRLSKSPIDGDLPPIVDNNSNNGDNSDAEFELEMNADGKFELIKTKTFKNNVQNQSSDSETEIFIDRNDSYLHANHEVKTPRPYRRKKPYKKKQKKEKDSKEIKDPIEIVRKAEEENDVIIGWLTDHFNLYFEDSYLWYVYNFS